MDDKSSWSSFLTNKYIYPSHSTKGQTTLIAARPTTSSNNPVLGWQKWKACPSTPSAYALPATHWARNIYEAELGPLVPGVMSATETKGHLSWLSLWEDNLVTDNVVTDRYTFGYWLIVKHGLESLETHLSFCTVPSKNKPHDHKCST